MATLTQVGGSWKFEQGVPTNGISSKLLLHLPLARGITPRVRRAQRHPYREDAANFEGKVRQASFDNGHAEFELLQGYNEGWFEVINYQSFAVTAYLSAKRVGSLDYIIKEFLNVNDCVASFTGNERGGYRVLSSPEGWGESRLLGAPGPRDRFERLLDFGVKGADPEPSVEEVLEKVVIPPPRVVEKIDDAEVAALLDGVQVAPKKVDPELEELIKLLDSV